MSSSEKRGPGSRRISFNNEVAAAEVAASVAGDSRAEAVWSTAPKDEEGLVPTSELAAIFEAMEAGSGGVKGGVSHFLRKQRQWMSDKAALTRKEFEIACGELEEWQDMSAEDLAKACEQATELPAHILDKLSVPTHPTSHTPHPTPCPRAGLKGRVSPSLLTQEHGADPGARSYPGSTALTGQHGTYWGRQAF